MKKRIRNCCSNKIEQRKGFTLIELVITIFIIVSLTTGVVYLSPKIIARQNFEKNIWQIINDLKTVQELARIQLERLEIEIDIDSNTYRYEKRKKAFEDNISAQIINRKLENNTKFKKINIAGINYVSGKIKFMYDEWGVPKKIDNELPGEIVITIETPFIKKNQNENLSVDIKISPGTGMIRTTNY